MEAHLQFPDWSHLLTLREEKWEGGCLGGAGAWDIWGRRTSPEQRRVSAVWGGKGGGGAVC